jgi:putative transcriptional regulator
MTQHHYTGANLKNIWLTNGFRRHETKWGSGTSYTDVEGLFRQIARHLCLSNHRLDGDGVRFLRKHLELTQDELGQALGCSSQAVAKWEKGEVANVPQAEARLLRLLVLHQLEPLMALDRAMAAYDQPPEEKIVLTYKPGTGWSCASQVQTSFTAVMTSKGTSSGALQKAFGQFGQFKEKHFSTLADNDSEFESNASQPVAA